MYNIYRQSQIQELCTYVDKEKAQEKMYINIYVQHELGWAVTSPNLFMGSDTIYNIYMAISGTGCPTKHFFRLN